MCNCDDNLNSTTIFSGPPGPTGPQGIQGVAGANGTNGTNGTTPIITGTSTTIQFLTTGSKNFVSNVSLNYVIGQRIRFASDDGTKVLEGVITSIATTFITVTIDYVKGSGSHSNWNIAICGEVGSEGATGATGSTGPQGATGRSWSTVLIEGWATTVNPNEYRATVNSSENIVPEVIIFIEGAGYFKVISVDSATRITVLDLLYPDYDVAGIVNPGGKVLVAGPSFIYETIDGNNTPATASSGDMLLVRNTANTGYEFMSFQDLKDIFDTLP